VVGFLLAVVGRPTTAVLRGKGRFAFVGMFPHSITRKRTRIIIIIIIIIIRLHEKP
jgi:hypothetical protein